MQLEDYFEVIAEDDIRLKGHRIGIDDVLKYYRQGYNPQEILQELPTLNLEKIYATLAYYHHNQTKIDAYLLKLERQREQHYQQWAANPSPLIERLRKAKTHQEQESLTRA
jgi:uncharacterized protein (DUF433 family)